MFNVPTDVCIISAGNDTNWNPRVPAVCGVYMRSVMHC